MIRKVSASNFMAYDDVSVEFDDDRLVSIIGDNGAGKSSFLEIIPFVIFGESRVPFDSLVKDGSDYLIAEVVIDDLKITRERKRSAGSSKLVVDRNGEIYNNKEATEFLSDYFGMDYFLFSLTSYFGLGLGDNIVTSGPKVRVSYLQRIANISIYSSLVKRVSTAVKKHRESIVEIGSSINEMKHLYEHEYEGLEDSIKNTKSEMRKAERKRDQLQKDVGLASTGRERIYHLTVEKKRLSAELKDLSRELRTARTEVETCEMKISDMMGRRKSGGKEETAILRFLKKYKRGLERLDRQIWSIKSNFELKRKGIDSFQTDEGCPLCGAEVAEEMVDEWKADADYLSTTLTKFAKFRDRVSDHMEIERIVKLKLKETENQHTYLQSELRRVRGEVVRKQLRLKKVEKEISEFYENTKLDDLESELNKVKNEISDYRASVNVYRRKRRRRLEWQDRMDTKVKDRDVAGLRLDVSSILVESFSQKGIPLMLLRDIGSEIEDEATRIFNYFETGRLVVNGLEGSEEKLDVSFSMETQSGVHSFQRLSQGQKALMLLSVRLALSKICFRSNPNMGRLNFIVLDEITSNLSDTKIEGLTQVVQSIMDSTFSQVFIISHADLPTLRPDMQLEAKMTMGDSTMQII